MKESKGKFAGLTAGILLPGVFRLSGEVFGESMQASPAVPLAAVVLCVGIAATAIYLAVRSVTG